MAVIFPLLAIEAQEDVKWPDFPLLSIETDGGDEPTATVVYPPEGAFGVGIVSDYVPGRLVMTLGDKNIYDSGEYQKGESGIRMKIRGNTSGAGLDQHPYKLKLSKKADLLDIDKKLSNKNWALLSMYSCNSAVKNSETNIMPLVGLAVCRALEFPWTPRTRFVNLQLNGKYCGLYHLIETVERDDNRVDIGKKGFLIENDAYWWKPGETYFKTDRQHAGMGYTFKYPDADDADENTINGIKTYMNAAENALYTHEHTADYFDYESFARWMLAHDILGTYDAGGSNMFLCKDVLNDVEPSESKLMMATPWDFDSAFMQPDDKWGAQRTDVVFYYPELFKEPEFCEKYTELYRKYRSKVYAYVEEYLNKLEASDGDAYEQSRQLHRQVYGEEMATPLNEQISDVLGLLDRRLKLIDVLMDDFTAVDGISASANPKKLASRTDIYGIDYTGVPEAQLPANFYVEKYSDGTVRKVYKK